jgi:hypothetical protein
MVVVEALEVVRDAMFIRLNVTTRSVFLVEKDNIER